MAGSETLPVLLATAYCGPVQYYSWLASSGPVYIDQFESYTKQSYRNRCMILSANGPAALSIPVEHRDLVKKGIRDVRISYDADWQRNHWRALLAAYNNSPFFRFYADEIQLFYRKKWTFLFEFNLEYQQKLLSLMKMSREILLTSSFEEVPSPFINLREVISPKKALDLQRCGMAFPPYTQVFSEQMAFVPGLSILDLLFNEGPYAKEKLLPVNSL